jgi:hypothetical protein
MLVEDWNKIMLIAFDCSGMIIPPFYFILVLLICTYFLINLIIAIFLKNWLLLVQERNLMNKEAESKTK